MKIFAIILLCTLIYSVKGDSKINIEAIEAVVNECKEKHSATDDDVAAVFTFAPAASTNAKCMRACAMKKFGLLNEDGKLVKETNLQFLNDVLQGDAAKIALAEEMVTICNDIKVSKDHCEAADEYLACTKKESEARGLKIF